MWTSARGASLDCLRRRGALHPAGRAVELGLWNRVVGEERLQEEVDALVRVLLSKNQRALGQLKLIIDHGVEADLHTAQGFDGSGELIEELFGAHQLEAPPAVLGALADIVLCLLRLGSPLPSGDRGDAASRGSG